MPGLQDEIEALRRQVAALTARVYALEQQGAPAPQAATQQAQVESLSASPPPLPAPPATIPPVVPAPNLHPAPAASSMRPAAPPRTAAPSPHPAASRGAHEEPDLEKRIGQYWLNRIGIVAILFGVSYFLKYAFDNNWIGPAGRITIGLLVGIGLVLIGGFASPVLLSTGENHEAVLFSYVALLDIAILVVAMYKPWRRLIWGSFIGTILMYSAWYSQFYSSREQALTTVFLMLFAALFAIVPVVAANAADSGPVDQSATILSLPLFNAGLFFLGLYGMYEFDATLLCIFALLLAAAYLGIGTVLKNRLGEGGRIVHLVHVAIAVAFITIAIPLKLEAQWITLGWLVEAGTLFWLGVRGRIRLLRHLAIAAVALGIVRLLFYDHIRADTLIFNMRFATYVAGVAVLWGMAIVGRRDASPDEHIVLTVAGLGANLLGLIAFTWEASDYFDRQMFTTRRAAFAYTELGLERNFSYSAIWLAYGVALMIAGFQRRSAFVRWQALVLIALTICKVFLFDLSQLGGSYRIVSFIALGAVLLGISFVYQRDWLKLSRPSAQQTNQGTR